MSIYDTSTTAHEKISEGRKRVERAASSGDKTHIAELEAQNAELKRESADDRGRLAFSYNYVRDRLTDSDCIEAISHLFGDAPADCGCREAACAHSGPAFLSLESIRDAIDAAMENAPFDPRVRGARKAPTS